MTFPVGQLALVYGFLTLDRPLSIRLVSLVMYLKFSRRTVAAILNFLIVGIVICSWAFVLSAGLRLSSRFLELKDDTLA